MKGRKVSQAVIRRLPRYYRHLELLLAHGGDHISSGELAGRMDLNPSQVRQDLNCFGGFGQQGYGYHVETLYKELGTILGLNDRYKVIVVGAGNIGQALTRYEGFADQGFDIVALFDIDEAIVGTVLSGIPVHHVDTMEEYIRENTIDIGIIAARRRAAQDIADRMVAGGIRGIWNFVPTDVAANVPVENVHLSDSMLVLSYNIKAKERE